jgi:3-hydroxy-9,10-secoandrosta-1,3,5(10)-triene-9,17-dione monooxygenase
VTSSTAPGFSALPQPEPGLEPAALVARAAALRPLLRAQQDENDARGRYSDELHAAFRDAGFYRILQPRRFGGYEFAPATFLEVIMEIARGHPGSAWCFTLAASHGYVLAAHWPETAQQELFGPEGEFLAAHVVMGQSTVTPVPGGFEIDGTWPFASGIPVATHFIGGAMVPDGAGSTKMAFFVTPRRNVEILDDWGGDASLGMQASGSNTVRLSKVFVPSHHVVDATMMVSSVAFPDGSPGVRLHGNPMYLGVLAGWFACEFGAIFSGAARAALDEYLELVRARPMFSDPRLKRTHDPIAQTTYGLALALADSAAALTLAAVELHAEQYRRAVADRVPLRPQDVFKVSGMGRQACFMACEAIEMLFHSAGASTGRRGQRLQRYFRDAQMFRLHIQAQTVFPTQRAQLEFGLPVTLFGQQF